MSVRGVRGANSVNSDSPQDILTATRELLEAILSANPSLRSEDIASCFFTLTPDLVSEYPAKAAREMGWTMVPLLCAQEIPVPYGIKNCVRVLIHWNTSLSPEEIKHVYLGEAQRLRPDLFTRQTSRESV